jgi:hypothetical protein
MSSRTASCSCGQLRIQVEGEPRGVGIATASLASRELAVFLPHWPASLLRSKSPVLPAGTSCLAFAYSLVIVPATRNRS